MKLRKIYDGVSNFFDNFGFELIDETPDMLLMGARINLQEYFGDKEIELTFTIGQDIVATTFVFDKVDNTVEVNELINAFNANSYAFKAFRNDKEDFKDYLTLDAYFFNYSNEKEAIMQCRFMVDQILNEDTLEILQQLVSMSY